MKTGMMCPIFVMVFLALACGGLPTKLSESEIKTTVGAIEHRLDMILSIVDIGEENRSDTLEHEMKQEMLERVFEAMCRYASEERLLRFCLEEGHRPDATAKEVDASDDTINKTAGERIVDFMCFSGLLSSRWIVTAAHCLESDILDVVRVGAHTLSTMGDATSTDHAVRQVIRHPRYSSPQLYHDIALVKLSGHVQFSRFVQPICVPKMGSDEFKTNEVWAVGWGHTYFGGTPSEKLLQTKPLKIQPHQACNDHYSSQQFRIGLPHGIRKGMLCALDDAHGSDACQGDSGGPLLSMDPFSGEAILVGIVSAGVGCGGSIVPGLYTDVSEYLPWIQKTIQ